MRTENLQHDHGKGTFQSVDETIDLTGHARCALLRSLERIRHSSCDTDECQSRESYFCASHEIFEQS